MAVIILILTAAVSAFFGIIIHQFLGIDWSAPYTLLEVLRLSLTYLYLRRYRTRMGRFVASQVRFQTILDTMPELVLLVDTTGDILYVNSAAQEVLKINPMELIGQNIFQIMDYEHVQSMYGCFIRCQRGQGCGTLSMRWILGGQIDQWFDTTFVGPIKNPSFNGVLVTSRNVTGHVADKATMEAALSIAAKALETATL